MLEEGEAKGDAEGEQSGVVRGLLSKHSACLGM
jgi:hypothetical protein